MTILRLIARRGRIVLVLGLLAGLASPAAATALRPWIGEMVALLLALTAFRVGPRAALSGLAGIRRGLTAVAGLQVAAPLAAFAGLSAAGLMETPFALATVLMLSAPPVTGSPNFAIMVGADPAPAVRILTLGSALFPITVLPILWLLPQLGGFDAALGASLTLIVVILGAVGAGFLARALFRRDLSAAATESLDGASALVLAVVVVGLMAAIGPLARSDPLTLLGWMAAVLALNLGLQIAAFAVLRRAGAADAAPIAIIAGNRNIALFLIALAGPVTDPLLIFIGCYQAPMYLTPLLLKRLYGGRAASPV